MDIVKNILKSNLHKVSPNFNNNIDNVQSNKNYESLTHKEINKIQNTSRIHALWKNTKRGWKLFLRAIKRNGLKIAIILLILFIIIILIYEYETPIDGSYQENESEDCSYQENESKNCPPPKKITFGQRFSSLFVIIGLTSIITMTLTIFDSENERYKEKDLLINNIKCKYNEFIFSLSKKYLSLDITYILEKEILDNKISDIYNAFIIDTIKKKTTDTTNKQTTDITEIEKQNNSTNNQTTHTTEIEKQNNLTIKQITEIHITNIKDEAIKVINKHLERRIKILYLYNLIISDPYLSDIYLQILKELDNIFYDKDLNINENIKLKEENILRKINIIKVILLYKIVNNNQLNNNQLNSNDKYKLNDDISTVNKVHKIKDEINNKIIEKCINYYINDLNNIFNKSTSFNTNKEEINNILNNQNESIKKTINDKYLNNNNLLTFIDEIFKTVCIIDKKNNQESWTNCPVT